MVLRAQCLDVQEDLIKKNYLLLACWVFISACRLYPVAAGGGYSVMWRVSFSLPWLFLLCIMGSRHLGFSSYSIGSVVALLVAGGILVPRPGIKPISPALASRLLTTRPPEKSQEGLLLRETKPCDVMEPESKWRGQQIDLSWGGGGFRLRSLPTFLFPTEAKIREELDGSEWQ